MKTVTLERLLIGILVVIAAGIVVHAPLTVWLGTIWPSYDLIIKSWKELLMGVAFVLFVIIAVKRKKVNELLSDRLMQLSLAFAGLHFVMMAVFPNSISAVGAGLLIDLRFILFFVLIYGTLQLFPQYRRLFTKVFVGGAVVVIGFALLQLFVLPKDVLAHIGYSKATISPYLTVDQNPAFIRINSTLRGPNPLGAFTVIVASLLLAVGIRWKLGKKGWWIAALAGVGTGMVLSASYSRSSFIGAIIALIAIVVVSSTRAVQKQLGIALGVIAVVIGGVLFAFRDSTLVSNLVWHDNPSTGSAVDSNSGHLHSLVDGAARLVKQPFGAGIGSTGSASLLSDKPIIIENQYLLVAHEAGWLGLALFVWLFVDVMLRLWEKRKSALALGVFGSGIGLAVIGLLLPVWTDDTVSIVWWGLAAVAIAGEKARRTHAKRKSN